MSRSLVRCGIVATVLVVSTVGVRAVWSYVRTAHGELGRAVRDAVPIAFELKRLSQLTQDLQPEIQANRRVAAQLDVEIEYLRKEAETLEQSQREAETQMRKLRACLDPTSRGPFQFGDQTFTHDEIARDLERRLAAHADARTRLDAKRKILASRESALAAATEKVRQYQQQYLMLTEKADSLQAELKLVELAQTTGHVSFDHTKLAEAKELATTVEKRIRTLHKIIEGESLGAQEIPVSADARPVAERFDEYFSPTR